jgi:hypothetical protein
MDIGIFKHLLYVCGIRYPAYWCSRIFIVTVCSMSVVSDTPHTGGHRMVPSINTILQRFSGEWAALLQPEAILTVGRDMG